MRAYALSLLLFASFFWLWAVKNTVGMETGQFDLGILSFATVMLTSSYLLGLANHHKLPSSMLTKILVLSSQIFVALNYAIGCYLGFAALDRPGFGLYCGIFTILWSGIGITSAKILKGDERNPSSAEDEQLNP